MSAPSDPAAAAHPPSTASAAAAHPPSTTSTAAASSSSGLTFKLHPLVIVNVSDHHTRVKAQSACSADGPSAASQTPRVFGCVIGVQRGRTVEIFNSFELVLDPASGTLERTFLEKKQELYKKVFPTFYVLGWYRGTPRGATCRRPTCRSTMFYGREQKPYLSSPESCN